MYHNQHRYSGIPYPHTAHPSATIKSSGCGVCSISMVVEGLTGTDFPPTASAPWSIEIGARVSGGTDMYRLGREAARRFGLDFTTTSDVGVMLDALRGGAWAIANVGGDRNGYTGVFSSGGHYVVVRGLDASRLIIWDPGYYIGKFDRAGRYGKVTVKGHDLYTLPAILDADCSNRWPRYYLFKKEEETMTQKEFNAMLAVALAEMAEKGASAWATSSIDKMRDAGVTDGSRPQSFATRQEVIAMLERAQRCK